MGIFLKECTRHRENYKENGVKVGLRGSLLTLFCCLCHFPKVRVENCFQAIPHGHPDGILGLSKLLAVAELWVAAKSFGHEDEKCLQTDTISLLCW